MGRDMRVGVEPKLKKSVAKPECPSEQHIITIEDILAAGVKEPEKALVAGILEKKSACPAIEVCDGQMCPQKLGIMCQEETSGAEAIVGSLCGNSSCAGCNECGGERKEMR